MDKFTTWLARNIQVSKASFGKDDILICLGLLLIFISMTTIATSGASIVTDAIFLFGVFLFILGLLLWFIKSILKQTPK